MKRKQNSADGPSAKKIQLYSGNGTNGAGPHSDDDIIYEKEVINPSAKCKHCRRNLDDPDLKLYSGDQDDAVEEPVMLTDTRLSLFIGSNNEDVANPDTVDLPMHKITNYTVFDPSTHLCSYDSGLIERNIFLYISGYVKPIYDEDPSIKDGILTRNIGPINEWWLAGFDGGEKALVGLATGFAEYVLMNPSEEYEPFLDQVKEKIYLSKAVMEFLLDEPEGSYEDLINYIQIVVPPPRVPGFTEDTLFKHAQFAVDVIQDYDMNAQWFDTLLVTHPCVRELITLVGLTVGKRRRHNRPPRRLTLVKKDKPFMKATTTPLVFNVFDTLFSDQLASDKEQRLLTARKKRCGVCEFCQQPDCGQCKSCADMVKFGGSSRSKQACDRRRCPNMEIAEAEGDCLDDDLDPVVDNASKKVKAKTKKIENYGRKFRAANKNKINCVGEPLKTEGGSMFYKSFSVNDEVVMVGEFVLVSPQNPHTPVFVAQVVRIWEHKKQKMLHAHWFCRASSTILGEAGDPLEVFMSEDCQDLKLDYVMCKCMVVYHKPSPSWFTDGGKAESSPLISDDGKSFFCQKWYHPGTSRFDDLPEDVELFGELEVESECMNCSRLADLRKFETPQLKKVLSDDEELVYESVQYRGEEFRQGSCVYLTPDAFPLFGKPTTNGISAPNNKEIDQEMYPECHRKTEYVRGSNLDVPEPYRIGFINKIIVSNTADDRESQTILMKINKFYRPEDTFKGTAAAHQSSLHLLYWTDEEVTVNFEMVQGKCYVTYGDSIPGNIEDFMKLGPNRFYFTQTYNSKLKTFETPDSQAQCMGRKISKGKGKGKGHSKLSLSRTPIEMEEFETYPEIEKLRTMDVFAGCGGMSEGLHQSGLAETLWAIEKEDVAASAYKLNFPTCTVFTEDCNSLLQRVIEGLGTDLKGQKLPKRGEVDLLVGGPPCQGFSGMNRFNSREYSCFKNSLMATIFSYCDYYRPRYFILENVRNFVAFKNNVVFKLTLACLLKMGYQVAPGILQAGSYGVPQTRRRAIIMAAAPGEKLPMFPEPSHVFNKRACSLSIQVGDSKIESNIRWKESAPYRTITVRDAMSDLPKITNGAKNQEIPYGGEPISHFQRMIRGPDEHAVLRDHICKEMKPLVAARISHIPTTPGSDWRDLPNLVVKLPDGSSTKKLAYTHNMQNGRFCGVCSCSEGKQCKPQDKQDGTLIPWCLPHTGDRHAHWAGLYGRLENDGFFSTTVTNPEPMGKQGRVLHPEQNRVVSVRECARSQGFPDTFRFYGNIVEKHRQIGNAVPPPLAAAIGREIMKSLVL